MPKEAEPRKPGARKATSAKPPAKATKKAAKKATPAKQPTKATKASKAPKATKATKEGPTKRASRSATAGAGASDPTLVVPAPAPIELAGGGVDPGGGADPRRSRARAILIGVVIGSVLAVLAVLLMGDDGSPSGASSTPSSTSTTVTAVADAPLQDVAPSIPEEGSSTTVTASGKAAPSSKATSTTVRSPTVVPVALAMPKAGKYPIKVVSSGREATGTLVISADGWQRRELGDAGGARTEQLSWSEAGARLVASGPPGEDGSCRWDGRSVTVPSDLRDGKTWSSRVTCESEVEGNDVKVVRVEEAKVTKRARTQLAGRSLDTWVIERRISVTIRAEDFTTTSVSISTELFAPGLGIPVYSTSRTDVPLPDGGTNAVYASEEVLGLP